MCLCESFLNISFGVYLIEFNDFQYIKMNRIRGITGQYVQKLIDSRRAKNFNCLLVGNEEVGEKVGNGSFTGGIKQIQNREIDLFFRQMPYLDIDQAHLTSYANSESYLTMQILNGKSELNESDLFLKFFDLKFTVYFFLTLLSLFLIVLIVMFFSGRKIFLILNSILKLDRNHGKFLLILSISFTIFYFITHRIFSINIKTEKVLVDKSDILLSEERIFKSKLKLAWIKGEPDRDLLISSPKGTFLNRLYELKRSNPAVIIDKKNDFSKYTNKFKNFFLFYNKVAIRITAFIFNVIFNLKLFVNENPFFSIPNYVYRIDEKSEKTEFIDRSLNLYFEHGFFTEYFRSLDNLKLIRNNDRIPIYYSLSEYIKDHTQFDALKFNNLYYLFLINLIIPTSIFVIFIIHHFIKYSIRRKLLRTSKNRYFVMKTNFRKICHSIYLILFKLITCGRRLSFRR